MGEFEKGLGATPDEIIESLREDLVEADATISMQVARIKRLEAALRKCLKWMDDARYGVDYDERPYEEAREQGLAALAGKEESGE